MRGIHSKGMRGKSNVTKKNVEKVWGARYLPKNTVILIHLFCILLVLVTQTILIQLHKQGKAQFPLLQLAAFNFWSCQVHFQRWMQITITLTLNRKF
jgi:hypothetical protein